MEKGLLGHENKFVDELSVALRRIRAISTPQRRERRCSSAHKEDQGRSQIDYQLPSKNFKVSLKPENMSMTLSRECTSWLGASKMKGGKLTETSEIVQPVIQPSYSTIRSRIGEALKR